MNELSLIDNDCFLSLNENELQDINGGFVLFTIIVGGVAYEVTAAAAAAIVAGAYGLSYAIGKGWAHIKNNK